jgi:hypothetical protein
MLKVMLFLALAQCAAAGWVISEAGKDPKFSLKAEGLRGLSGLAWCQGDLYYAVSDRERALVPLRLTIDPASGAILAGRVEPLIPVTTSARDFEDVVCD